jgi:hypothetical protein
MARNRGTVRAGSQAEGPAAERLSSVNDVTELRIEFEIGRERLIGQQADFQAPRLDGATLGMVQ